ncbi:disease resistance protein RGA2-like [Panicum hallii]|uniref:disease resistance protein RGA2-like n=1 Tax=Panicum hallii TaxID=206008 RepID=UPI000DF4E4F2|nr:disease resistance protein RGA2-like [Panicum hallii]
MHAHCRTVCEQDRSRSKLASMAGSLLLPLVGRVAGKAADAVVEGVTRMWGVDGERGKLERQLLAVQSLLVDAEAQNETKPAIKWWMEDLRAAAGKAEDVLDGFEYEALRREAQAGAGSNSTSRKVIGYLNVLGSPLWFRLRASWELRGVLGRINGLVKEMNTFGLVERKEPQQVAFRQTHSALDDSAEIVGREGDREVVVEMLLRQRREHAVQVLPIVGMGGLGKTTLAKMVYNDLRVQKHFELRMWHCVSQANLDACPIVKSIIELATEGRCDLPDTFELLQGRLQQEIGRRRYLLILDDVWNEEQPKWEEDLKPLLCSSIGGSGSIILVTSRSQKVACIMGTLPPYELSCLSEDDSWELFSMKAFSKGVQEQAELAAAGRRIVDKCKGLPLALKIMGGLMSSKQQARDWETIADTNLGHTNSGKDEIISILKLSYKQLTSEMKQCFAFCAVFPKDSSVCTLYHLESLKLNYCSVERYLPEGMTSMKKLRHINLLECGSLVRMPSKLSLLHNLRTLTTFVVDTEDGCGIEELQDMRQLSNRLELYNLSKVKSGSKANLHEKQNLSELSLYWGRKVSDIPKIGEVNSEVEVLESLLPYGGLKILEIYGYGGHEISQWMRDPQMFQYLRELIVSNCPRCKDLPIVWLSSSLEHLSLSNMVSLTTICHGIDVEAEGCSNSLLIFPKLKRMELSYLPELERWAGNSSGELNGSIVFLQLEELIIYDCYKLSTLPESPVLTHLVCISYTEDQLVSMSMPLYSWPSLASLKVGLLANMVVFPPDQDQQSQSPRPLEALRSLEVKGDYGFVSTFSLPAHLDCFTAVEELVISNCSNIVRWPLVELRCFARLRSLHISHCTNLGQEVLEGSSSEETLPLLQLERLSIVSCDSLTRIPMLPASLEQLDISRCTSMVALPPDLGNLAKLKELCVLGCHQLRPLPDGMDGLTSLEALTIRECPKIQKFPEGLLQRVPTLKTLTIGGCPDLQKRCGQGGEYLDLVASIPRRSIKSTKPIKKDRYMPHLSGIMYKGMPFN